MYAQLIRGKGFGQGFLGKPKPKPCGAAHGSKTHTEKLYPCVFLICV